MQSFLFISNEPSELDKMVDAMCLKNSIHAVDKITLSVDKNIGIADIRNLQKRMILTPVKSPLKVTIIDHADTLTPDAQNAFLKTLEEPPPHTLVILLAMNKEHFLPTIISRCSIIEQHTGPKQSERNVDDDAFLQSFPQLKTIEAMVYAQNYGKTKEFTTLWLEKTILTLREKMIRENNRNLVSIIRIFQKTHTVVKQTNVSPRLALEQMFLDLL